LWPTPKEQIIQMNNGCMCCTIREDLRETLTDLAKQKQATAP
jgi:G3E family GTPase